MNSVNTVQDQTVDGAMFQLLTKMDMREPDVLMLEMTHGTVVINMIPLPAHQDGLVMRTLESALWPTQVTDSDQELPARTTAMLDQTHHQKTNLDAILPATNAKSATRMILDVHQIEPLNVPTARTQIQTNFTNVTEPTLRLQNVMHVKETKLKAANQEPVPVTAAISQQIYSSAIQRPSLAIRQIIQVISSKLAMPHVDTSPHKSF
jgi:hypothetical protein